MDLAEKKKQLETLEASDLKYVEVDEYAWLTRREEGGREKLVRKIKENPLVPIGLLGTSVALGYGLVTFQRGNVAMSQTMMRTRVAAQGFTVAALVIGLGMAAYQDKAKKAQIRAKLSAAET